MEKHFARKSEHSIDRRHIRCAIYYLLVGFISVLLGILSIIFDFQELALTERIKLRPGLPAYEMWKNPSELGVDIGIKVYLFAVENPDEFLANSSTKLKLKEIGPIIYKKVMRQEDIVFHEENSTMSFSTVFHMEYYEERNEPGILNKTITVLNPVLLSFAAMAHDKFLARMAFNIFTQDDHVFLNRTIYDILWNNTSPTFDFVKQIPFAAPRQNAGIMFNAFYPSDNRFNVNIGTKHGYENFFRINTLNDLSRIDAYSERHPKHCPVSLTGSTEGTGLPPHMRKDDVIYAYTRNLCRTYPMVYNNTETAYGLEAYRYILADEIYTRSEDPESDCFKWTGSVLLPNGLSDTTACAFGLPVSVSNPHFWGYHGEWENYIEGLKPNQALHSSHVLVEPHSGVQLEGVARIQTNLPMPQFNYFSLNIQRFSNMILPQFWMEYYVINRDPLLHLFVMMFLYLPVIQVMCVIIALALGVYAFYKSTKIILYLSAVANSQSTNFLCEKDKFVKQQLLGVCPES